MSSCLTNLSFAIKIPTTAVQSENLVAAVNKTLTKFHAEQLYQDYLNVYNIWQSLPTAKKFSSKMESERLILCETNAGLWNKALNSAISLLTENTHPHYVITQNFIYYLLNEDSNADVGLTEEYFCRLLLTFPPRQQAFNYYWQILSQPLLDENDIKVAEPGLFVWVLDTLTSCLKSKKILDTDLSIGGHSNHMCLYSNEKFLQVIDDFNGIDLNLSKKKKDKKNDFEAWNGKLYNLLVVLNFLYDILECNFGFWISDENASQERRCLLSCLLWGNARDIGLTNDVQKIINLYKLVLQSSHHNAEKLFVIKKLIGLVAEVMRCSDMRCSDEGMKYPSFGNHSNNLARQISQILFQHFQELKQKKEPPMEIHLILNLKPPWLKLLLCSYLLTSFTGYQCLPELTGVYDILENIVHTEEGISKSTKKRNKRKIPKNSKIVQELKAYKSINSKLCNGKTLLHMACEENDVEKVQALLTFPELDVNATDREGWTALHVAAFAGNSSCVQELLAFSPKSGDVRKGVNTRALGPRSITALMCAVTAGSVEVCQMLLEHTGSVLLEDFNELNETALELSDKPEVTKILKHYKDNHIWTSFSQKDINFDVDFKEIIIRLCVELVQAYFTTHRTWDVYRTLKESDDDAPPQLKNPDKFKWDYLRYQRDIKRNIYKLRKLVPKLENVPEFKSSKEIFTRLLTFNKT